MSDRMELLSMALLFAHLPAFVGVFISAAVVPSLLSPEAWGLALGITALTFTGSLFLASR